VEELPGEAYYPPDGPQVDHHPLLYLLGHSKSHHNIKATEETRLSPIAIMLPPFVCLNCHPLNQRDLYVDVRVAAEGYGLKWERCKKKSFH